jgi:hypothetical protein
MTRMRRAGTEAIRALRRRISDEVTAGSATTSASG